MAEQDIQLQGLKTIREMQESMQKDMDTEEQKTLQTHIKETQQILDGSADKEVSIKNVKEIKEIPNLANAKTIKESMADWVDDKTQNASNTSIIKESQVENTTPIEQKDTTKHDANFESDIAELKQEKYQQIVTANANSKQETWLLLDEFLKLSGLEKEKVQELINEQAIKSKEESGRIYVEASTGTSALIKKVENRLVSLDMSGNALDPVFVEKTIATILGLHDKVLSSKDETISAFKSENSFLKEALVSMQEIYDDDKKTIEILRQQLQKTQEEVDFVKRKYKLMWGKISNSTT